MLKVIRAVCGNASKSLINCSNRLAVEHDLAQYGGDGLQEEVRVFCPLEPTTATNSLPDWRAMLAQRRHAPAAPPGASHHRSDTPTLSFQAQGTPDVTAAGAVAVADCSRYRSCLFHCHANTRLPCACKSNILLPGCSGHTTPTCPSAPSKSIIFVDTAQPCALHSALHCFCCSAWSMTECGGCQCHQGFCLLHKKTSDRQPHDLLSCGVKLLLGRQPSCSKCHACTAAPIDPVHIVSLLTIRVFSQPKHFPACHGLKMTSYLLQ